jgi:molecular chaperone GrpE (heat shock protein)
MHWLSHLFTRKSPPPLAETAPLVPDWALELTEAVQKVGRSQAKVVARVEALESKLEGGFSDLRAAVTAARPVPASEANVDAVLDALDVLDAARRALRASGHALAEEGLAGVTERLERFLDGSGLSRRAAASAPLDGKVFRVVGTVERTDLPDGSPVEVVRAAALAGDRLVREGEVLVNRRPAT